MLLGLQDWQWYGIINKGGFRPNKITGLQLWLDANDASTLFQDAAKTTSAGNGDVIGAWVDKSGQGNDATQATTANKPTRQDGIVNGRPVVRGDTDDIMDLSGVTVTNETIFVVASHAVNNVSGDIISAGSGNRFTFTSTVNSVRYQYNGVGAIFTGGFVETDPNIIRGQYDGANATISVNSGTPVTTARVSSPHTFLSIFARSDVSNWLNGDIAELLVYNTALSTPNIALIENYLRSKWGTP